MIRSSFQFRTYSSIEMRVSSSQACVWTLCVYMWFRSLSDWKYFTICSNLKNHFYLELCMQFSIKVFHVFFQFETVAGKIKIFSIVSMYSDNAFSTYFFYVYIFTIIYSNYNRRKRVRAITYFKISVESKSVSKSHFYLSVRAQFSLDLLFFSFLLSD